MLYWINRIIWKILNIIKWLPILWKQFDFDYRYAIDAFVFQLEKTATFLEGNKTYTVCAKTNGGKLRTILKLIKKVREEDYAMEYMDEVDNKYPGAMDFCFEDIKEKPGFSELKFKYQYWDNHEEIKKFIDERKAISKFKQQKAERILIELMKHNLPRAWD